MYYKNFSSIITLIILFLIYFFISKTSLFFYILSIICCLILLLPDNFYGNKYLLVLFLIFFYMIISIIIIQLNKSKLNQVNNNTIIIQKLIKNKEIDTMHQNFNEILQPDVNLDEVNKNLDLINSLNIIVSNNLNSIDNFKYYIIYKMYKYNCSMNLEDFDMLKNYKNMVFDIFQKYNLVKNDEEKILETKDEAKYSSFQQITNIFFYKFIENDNLNKTIKENLLVSYFLLSSKIFNNFFSKDISFENNNLILLDSMRVNILKQAFNFSSNIITLEELKVKVIEFLYSSKIFEMISKNIIDENEIYKEFELEPDYKKQLILQEILFINKIKSQINFLCT